MVDMNVIAERDLTVFVCSGGITREEIVNAIEGFYRGAPTKNVIWNMLEADVTSVLSDDVSDLAQFVKDIAHSRPDGKTALVAAWDATYGMSRMYQTWAEASGQSTAVNVFRDMTEAEAWIGAS